MYYMYSLKKKKQSNGTNVIFKIIIQKNFMEIKFESTHQKGSSVNLGKLIWNGQL